MGSKLYLHYVVYNSYGKRIEKIGISNLGHLNEISDNSME